MRGVPSGVDGPCGLRQPDEMDASDFRSRQVLRDLARIAGQAGVGGPVAVLCATDVGQDLVWAALARLLTDALENWSADPALPELWYARVGMLRKAPAPLRAGLMNGAKRLRDLGLIADMAAPDPSALITTPLARLAPALMRDDG